MNNASDNIVVSFQNNILVLPFVLKLNSVNRSSNYQKCPKNTASVTLTYCITMVFYCHLMSIFIH